MYVNRLNATTGKLTYSEEKLAKYIDAHRSEINDVTSHELADRVGVSQSSVVRFSQKLGYASYKKMILDLEEGNDQVHPQSISIDEGTAESCAAIYEQYKSILESTITINDASAIDRAVQMIHTSERVIVFGYSFNNLFAQYFTRKLTYIGINAFCGECLSYLNSVIMHSKETDVIVLISESGETAEVLRLAKLAKQFNLRILSITKMAMNSLQQLADLDLKIVGSGSYIGLSATTLPCSQLVLFDILYTSLLKKNVSAYQTKLNKLYNQLQIPD